MRLTRSSPVTAFTRTSQNTAPNECIDQCLSSVGTGALASTERWSRFARDRIEA